MKSQLLKSQAGAPSSAVSSSLGAQEELLRIEHVSQRFRELEVLQDVDLSIASHQRVALLGPSGCGKSTLLNVIGGLIEPSAGRAVVGGEASAAGRLRHCALMPQKDLLLPWRTALDNASLALQNRGLKLKQARDRARPLFERVGLAEFESRRPLELSGGMRQRVAFLRTLLAEKEILLLDEPFGALDSITRGEMHEWLLSVLDDTPRTLILVTHDVEEAVFLCDRVLVFSKRPGRIVLDMDVRTERHESRRETISAPDFVALKDRALEALQ